MRSNRLFIRLFLFIISITSFSIMYSVLNSGPAVHPLHPDDYVIFAFNQIQIGQKSQILSGSIGVNNAEGASEIILDQKVETPAGFYIKADRIQIKQNAIIKSDVHTNLLDNKGTITGEIVNTLAFPLFQNLPEFVIATPGPESFSVSANQILTLEPGAYDALEIANKGSVFLTGGIYHFNRIDLEANASLICQDTSQIRVLTELSSKNDAFIGPDPDQSFLNASNVVFHAACDVDLGQNNQISASIYAPNHQISLGQHSECTGAFWAKDVIVGEDVILSYNGGIGVLDDFPPELTVTGPQDGLITSALSVMVEGTVTDNRSALLTINGVSVPANVDGSFAYEYLLIEGTNQISVHAVDPADNDTLVELTVIRDTQPPELTILSPAEGLVTDIADLEISGHVTDSTIVVLTINSVVVNVDASGSFSGNYQLTEGDNIFMISAVDAAGNVSEETRTVTYEAESLPPDPSTVAPPLSPYIYTPFEESISFLYTGSNPIQTDVDTAAMEEYRLAVVRGKVLKRDNTPLSGVTVTIKGHTEFGKTLTRADGWFDMAVNGGGYVTIDYQKEGYLPLQRQIDTDWQDFAVLDSVIMIALDHQATIIQTGDTIAQVARGSVVTDVDGSRQATMFFPEGIQANMVLQDGTEQPLPQFTFRATEYTVGPNGPAAMPAPLPANVAYTYCVELSADEAIAVDAKSVEFDQSAYFYLENFLGFPVGSAVPVGYYDRERAVWVPSDNGRVIEIVGLDGNLAELDITGDGIVDDLTKLSDLGIQEDELIELASLYSIGETLWRTPVQHLTPWDCNWTRRLQNANKSKINNDKKKKKRKPPCPKPGSIIDVQNRTLSEIVPITNTNINLVYKSDRSKLYGNTWEIQLTNISSQALPIMKSIKLSINIAGKHYSKIFSVDTMIVYNFFWDGKDCYNRQVLGTSIANIKIGYIYEFPYQAVSDSTELIRLFGNLDPNLSIEVIPARSEFIYWQTQKLDVSTPSNSVSSPNGWSINVHHQYDPKSKKLIMGTGKEEEAHDADYIINTLKEFTYNSAIQGQIISDDAGAIYINSREYDGMYFNYIQKLNPDGAIEWFAGTKDVGDSSASEDMWLNDPWDIDIGPDGSLYITDIGMNRIRKIDPSGIASTYKKISKTACLSVADDGSVYYFRKDSWYPNVRKIDTEGNIIHVAGWIRGYSGDGGPATKANLYGYTGMDLGPDGSLYFVDGQRIRKIDPDGIIWTVAGTGSAGYNGDDIPATQAKINNPRDIVVGSDGTFYFTTYGDHRIRKVTPDSIIHTICGMGIAGFGGDGVDALSSPIYRPWGLDINDLGQLVFVEYGNHRVRMIDTDNQVYTIAGVGTEGFSGDGNSAVLAEFSYPRGICLAHDGTVYVVDTGNKRIRVVHTDGVIQTLAGNGDWNAEIPDGELAVNAHLDRIGDFTFGPDGSLYILSSPGNCIRMINPQGKITKIGGNGQTGYSGDNGPALEASFNGKTIAVDQSGVIYVAQYDYTNGGAIRKIMPDGHVYTCAGKNGRGYTGDGDYAINAQLGTITDMVVQPDGILVFTDVNYHVIRQIDMNGIITTIAGTGAPGFSGDGGEAVDSQLKYPYYLANFKDGTLLVTDRSNYRIRRIGTDGMIRTIAGNGTSNKKISFSEDGNFATTGRICPEDLTVLPNGNIAYCVEDFYVTPAPELYTVWHIGIRELTDVYPGTTKSIMPIASASKNQIYHFDKYGKHILTKDLITGITMYQFQYDSTGQLTGVLDQDCLKISFDRNTENGMNILSPFGLVTKVTFDSLGNIIEITNPANETIQFEYYQHSLMKKMVDPKGYRKDFVFSKGGKFINETDAVGARKQIGRSIKYSWDGNFKGYDYTYTSAEKNTTKYEHRWEDDGSTKLNVISENGVKTSTHIKPNGQTITTSGDGTISMQKTSADPLYGMMSPLTDTLKVTTPSGLTSIMHQGKSLTQIAGLEVIGQTDTVVVNGRTSITEWDGMNRTYTSTSPSGRQSFSYLNDKGRTVKDSIPGILSVNYTYDDKGFLTQTRQGDRFTTFEYDSLGRLSEIIDPINRSTQMEYDAVDRVTKQTLADGREIEYAYDANGNLIGLTPPGKPTHFFGHTPVNLTEVYLPPEIADSTGNTSYEYNLDRQLVSTTLSDSTQIVVVYDTSSCGCSGGSKPLKVITRCGQAPACETDFVYSETSGQMSEVRSQRAGQEDTLRFSYDGSLPLSVEWAGAVSGRVDVAYNNDFRVTSQSVNGSNTVNFNYDNDGLLNQAGDLTISHDPVNGMLTGTSLDSITTSHNYNTYGELKQYVAQYGLSDIFNANYTLDDIGRITGITETCLNKTNAFNYEYDLSGRLVRVSRNDTLISEYFYDDNGNRIAYIANGDTVRGLYDEQDRMLSYGSAEYIYNAQGSLTTKIFNNDTTRYTYDLMGNLLAISLPNGDEVEYLIDPQNRRVGKILNGVNVRKWIYQDQLNPIAELDGAGNLISRFVYGDKGHVPAYMIKSGITYRIITNHLGSVRAVVNVVTGEVVQEISYDEFGVVLQNTNPEFQPFAYAGGLYDVHTGLVRFGARDYNAGVGRWTAKDPIAFDGRQTNIYSYCNNCPIYLIDPSGLVDLMLSNINEAGGTAMLAYDCGPHCFSVGAHGEVGRLGQYNKKTGEYDDVSPAKLAEMIKADKKYKKGMPVRLMACKTGKSTEDQKAYADMLSKELDGARVDGPTETLRVRWGDSGGVDVNILNGGKFQVYPQ